MSYNLALRIFLCGEKTYYTMKPNYQPKTYFITGIDTDCGKTIVTGIIAKSLKESGIHLTTQKLVQTGCEGISEDILKHREIMGEPLNAFDKDETTCPIVYSYPASPHLAAEIDNVAIDLKKIEKASEKLKATFDLILLEGAGGLMVPLTRDLLTIDWVQQKNWPVILVTSSKLGSINHTLMSLEIIKNRGIELAGVIYNHYPTHSSIILEDSVKIFHDYLKENFDSVPLVEVPVMKNGQVPIVNCQKIFR